MEAKEDTASDSRLFHSSRFSQTTKVFASIFKSEEKRLLLIARLLPVFVLLCLGFAWKLWISRPFYPFVPVFDFIPPFPSPFDFIFLGLFVGVLIANIVRPCSKKMIGGVLAFFIFFFLQDQSRIWPSFYMYTFLFLILFSYRRNASHDAHRILTGLRFIVIGVYFWGGIQKLNTHFFNEEFPWFVQPITDFLPFDVPYLPAIGALAAIVEVLFGIGLLTKRFRKIALFDAMLMHALILVCIGPLRGNWNNSSWMWGLTMGIMAFVLFYKAPPFDFKKMFGAPGFNNLPQGLAVIFIGFMPLLNNVNRWDAALSFNVYTGNVNYAQIHIRPDVADQLPKALLPFVSEHPERAVLNLNAWTLQEFNANPYPEKRIFKAVQAGICSLMPEGTVYLYFQEKSSWFSSKKTQRFGCGEI